jgi:TolA-binding protein
MKEPRAAAAALTLTLTLALGLAVGSGCAHQGAASPLTPGAVAAPPNGVPVTTYEMEPMKITAVSGADGVHVEAYDAAELFEQASKALSEKRFDDAIGVYDRLLREFDDTRYTRAAIYNAGLAHQGKKDWPGALRRFQTLASRYPQSTDAKDALFQEGATYAEVENWPASVQVFAQLLERPDLSADDRLEALARRGFAQFQLHDMDTAERTFQSAVSYFHQVEADERLETDFYLALAQYHLGQVNHERFRAAPLRLPERQMGLDLDEKARLLLVSQRQYIDTIKLGNAEWAAASGFQIGSLYEELYDAFVKAPVPPELQVSTAEAKEKLDIYNAELRKKIRILLEKSVRTHEANLLMMERMGVRSEWRDKSKLAFAKLQTLLDPSYAGGPLPTSAAAPSGGGAPSASVAPGQGAPPVPAAPPSRAAAVAAPPAGPAEAPIATPGAGDVGPGNSSAAGPAPTGSARPSRSAPPATDPRGPRRDGAGAVAPIRQIL